MTFAGPGFPRQDGQPRAELQLETVDDGKMLDAEETEHGPEVPSYQMFDSAMGRGVTLTAYLRCPSGAADQIGYPKRRIVTEPPDP